MRCSGCRSSEVNPSQTGQFNCHRFPPSPVVIPQHNRMTGETGISITFLFPVVDGDSYCDEFKVRKINQ